MMGAVVGKYFEWSDLKSPETVSLNLQHAKVGTIIDEVKSWPEKGKLHLDGFVYDNFHRISPTNAKERLEWLRRQPPEQFLPQPYEQLAKVLKNAGHEKAGIEVLIAKNCDGTNCLKWSCANFCNKFFNSFFNVFVGYGYRPSYAFWWSLVFIFFGAITFYSGHVNGLIKPTKPESRNYPVFNAPAYSMENFVPLIKLQVADSYAPNANRGDLYKSSAPCFIPSFPVTGGSLLRYYLWFHIIAGWFFTTLWVGGLTGLIRR